MRSIKYIVLFCLVLSFMGCSEDKLNPTSIFQDSKEQKNDFDKWLKKNYTDTYNIKFDYKYTDIESNMNHNLIPADYTKSIIMAKLVKYLWLDAYTEVTKSSDPDFMKKYAPRVMHLLGSAAWQEDKSRILGEAEGGLKISLFEINGINPKHIDMDHMNDLWFHTIHHEFGHILQQTKPYSTDFQKVSAGDYTSSGWTELDAEDALHQGFISGYSSMEYNEDFVEILSLYVVHTDAWWQKQLAIAKEEKVSKEDFDKYIGTGGVKEVRIVGGQTQYYIVYNGDKKILAKWQIIADYLKDKWHFTIEDLHKVVQRREKDVPNLDLTSLTD